MRRFIFLILILILSVWLGLEIYKDPGSAVFTYNRWTVETPLWFAAICVLAFAFLLHFILNIFHGVESMFSRFKHWLRTRRKQKAYSKTNEGLLDLIEGNWQAAESALLAGVDQSDAPLINYIAAAKAAHERMAYDKRDLYLQKAHDLAPKAEMAIGLTQAQLQYNQGQYEQALVTLNHLRSLAPRHPVVLKLLERIYIHQADWHALLTLLPSLRKAKLFTSDQFEQLEKRTYQEILDTSATKNMGLSGLQQVWDNVPRRFRKDILLQKTYAKKLLEYPETVSEAEQLINKILKKSWDKELVLLFGQGNMTDARGRLVYAEGWLSAYPHQPALLLTLGCLAVRCQFWGKAKAYFEESLQLEINPEAYYEYGKLLEKLGDLPAAAVQYKQGLQVLG